MSINCRFQGLSRIRQLARDRYTEEQQQQEEEEEEEEEDLGTIHQDYVSRPITKDVHLLKTQVKDLQSQVKTLKKMLVLTMFESKKQFKDFFVDIW